MPEAEQLPERRRDMGDIRERLVVLETAMHGLPARLQQIGDDVVRLLQINRDAEAAYARDAEAAHAAHARMEGAIIGLRTEVLGRIEQHDKRDDERFEAHGSRLSGIEQRIGQHDTETAGRRRDDEREHARRITMLGAGVGFAAAIVGSIVLALAEHWFK